MVVRQGTKVITVKTAVFRADAGTKIGAGHVMRCLALAKALEETGGWRCGFAAAPGAEAMVPSIDNLASKTLELVGPEENEADEIAAGFPQGCDLLVVDHYQRDERFEQACRPWAKCIMVIDDLADRRHNCDFLLDQTLRRLSSGYTEFVPSICKLLVGSEYALLRPEFSACRWQALAQRKLRKQVRRVLVTLGSSDSLNATSLVLDGIDQSGVKVAVDVVLGQDAPHTAAVKRQIARLQQEVTFHQAPANMAALMSGADIAIGAAGTTSWERCCLGLPTLMVITAENQRVVAEQLDNIGAAHLLGTAGELTAKKIGSALKGMLNDIERRTVMSSIASGICDGRGLDRVILALAAANGQGVWLRLADSDDAALMFEWQSQNETRRFARNQNAPSWTEHSDWMDRMSADAGVLLMLIMMDNEPSGVLRLDEVDNPKTREISIYVAPRCHGQGIASAALKYVRAIYPGWTFIADVMPDNLASHALFQSAGYIRHSKARYLSNPVEILN